MTPLPRGDAHSFILSWLLCLHHRLRVSISGVQEGQNFSPEDSSKRWVIAGLGRQNSLNPFVLQCNIQLQQSFPKPLSTFWFLQLKKPGAQTSISILSCSLACYRSHLLSPRACTSSRLWQMSSHLAWQPQYFHMQWQELFSKLTNTVANSKDWLNQLQNKTTKTESQSAGIQNSFLWPQAVIHQFRSMKVIWPWLLFPDKCTIILQHSS